MSHTSVHLDPSEAAREHRPAEPPPAGGRQKNFFLLLVLMLCLHVALVFLLGTRKPIQPRPVANVPHLQLANSSQTIVALDDPTLFARPNVHDLASLYWRAAAAPPGTDFKFTEAPKYLPPLPGSFGALFHQVVENSRPADFLLNLKPEPRAVTPDVVLENVVPQASTMRISSELASRLIYSLPVPSIPENDVLKPCTVQALVDQDGKVISAVVLNSPAGGNNQTDQQALQLVRQLRFKPAPRVALGEITFTWHTVPTNTLPAPIP